MIEVSVEDVRDQAQTLAEEGNLPKAAGLLVEQGLTEAAARLVDAHVVRLTSQARYTDVMEAVELLPRAQRSLVARVALHDARRHEVGVVMAELEVLLEETKAAGRADLNGWVAAVLVEHLLLDGDLFSIVLAAQYLAQLPEDPLPSALVLQARGRLRRVVALMHLAAGPENEADGRAELDLAIADLARASWETERWVSVSLFYFFYVSHSWSAPPAVMHAITEARDQLLALDSSQVHFARFTVLSAAYANGDVTSMRAELAQLRRLTLGGKPTSLTIFAEHFDALVEVSFFGDDAAYDQLARAADELRRVHPSMSGPLMVRTTQTLLDLGRAKEAGEWFGRLRATTVLRAHDTPEREVMACRLAMLEGGTGVEDRLLTALEAVREVAHPRVTGGLALRSAMTAARAGLPGLAAELRRLADRDLPAAESERTGWERYWARTVEDPEVPAVPADPPVTRSLRLLAPAVEVSVDGEPRHLAPNVARLLVTLAALGRAVGAEELGDLLWSDVDPARARGRLKSALHRLRQALSLEPDELVQREGDVVRFVADPRWSIDLHDFYRLADGSDEDRQAALRLFGGVLCNAQFAYDDVLSQERAVLETRWLALAGDLAARGLVEEPELRRRAGQLGLPYPD